MSPDDLDRLSSAELKGLIAQQQAQIVQQREQIVELQRLVAALRNEVARLKGGPGRPNIKPSGMEKATELKDRRVVYIQRTLSTYSLGYFERWFQTMFCLRAEFAFLRWESAIFIQRRLRIYLFLKVTFLA